MSSIPKSKTSGKRKKDSHSTDFSPSTEPPKEKSSSLFFKNIINWASFGLILLALFMIQKGSVTLGEVILVVGVLAQFGQTTLMKAKASNPQPKSVKEKTASSLPHPIVPRSQSNPNFQNPFLWFALLLAAGMFFFCDMLGFASHIWMFPPIQAFPFRASYGGLLAAWIFMAAAMMRLPSTPSPSDLSSRTSRWLLLSILGLALFMVSYRPLWPAGSLYEDNIVSVTTARLVKEIGDWKVFFDGGIGNSWQPFCSDLDSLIWLIAPGLSAFAVQKLSFVLIEAVIILLAYLAGKEAVNRRAGLFAAALCAISHPIITRSVLGCRGNAQSMAILLAVWLFFRALNRPRMVNFLWWGTAVAFSIYTYIINRPFVLIAVVSALAWILIQQKEERDMDRPTLLLTFGTLAAFTSYMAYTNHLFATNNLLSFAIDSAGYSLPCLALAVLWIMGVYLWPKAFHSGKHPYLTGWIAATWLAMILSFPKMADPYEYAMMAGRGVTQAFDFKPFQSLSILFDSNSTDWADFHIKGDSYFGPLEFTLGALGLAFAVARPTLTRLFLGGLFSLFCVTWLFTAISFHTERLQPCIGPLLLLAGLALEQIWSWLCALTRSKLVRVLFVGSFAGLLVWTAKSEFEQLHGQYVDRFLDVDVAVWRHVTLDQSQGYHVYAGPNMVMGRGGYILFENNPIEYLEKNNVITLDANEKLQDLAIYLRKTDPHDMDDPYDKRIHELFPDAKWEDIRNPWDSDQTLIMSRCVIPAADLLKPQDLFTVQTVPSPCWTRSYFYIENALHPGFLDWKTRITQADAPPPDGALARSDEFVRYEGTINVGQAGNYDLDCAASTLTVVKIDGKNTLNMIFPYTQNFRYRGPGEQKEKTINLSQGSHTLEVTTTMPTTNTLADIRWRHSGDKNTGTSIWNSFGWK
jgi:hypothetical protein